MNDNWTDNELNLIIQDYFNMLSNELKGIAINKTEHRNHLISLLNGRSPGSVEFKHQNISAVLAKIGVPFISGYKPRYNLQRSLVTRVVDYLQTHQSFQTEFERFVTTVPNLKRAINFKDWIVAPPEKRSVINEPSAVYSPIKCNYLEREQNNRDLGQRGEELAVEYERNLLILAGKQFLADRIEWVSKEQGDGLGFDILSRNINGTDKYIEVKTTKLTKEAPFYFTSTELNFSIENESNFNLYRIYDFNNEPRMFRLQGRYDKFCHIIPTIYKGLF